jgi:GTP-binding protein EngB required for normal cell division
MDTLTTLIQKVNTKTADSPIFFATNDAERALGLERLLNNYHIICIDDNDMIGYLQKENVNIFCLEKKLGKLNGIFRNSNRLLNHKFAQEYISSKTNNSGYLMFFKIAPNLERTADKLGFKILNTTSELNRKFELKLSQYDAIKDINIRLPKTVILKLKDGEFDNLTKSLGNNFIVQFNRGHTGGGTIEIDFKAKFDELRHIFPNREVKITKQIYGPAYTLNACITRQGICWGGLSYQMTGVEECTSEKLATVGNDWLFPKNLSPHIHNEIGKTVTIIGQEMSKHGFIGMFGLDIVIDRETNLPYIIEINARQPASIPMFAKLQILINQIPLNLLAIAEFLDIDYRIDVKEYNKKASSYFEASQLFIRNKLNNPAKVIGGVKVGAYRLVGDNSAYNWNKGRPKLKTNVIIIDEDKDKPLVLDSEAYAIDSVKAGILILCTKEGKVVSPNAEVARIQAKQSLLDKSGKLTVLTKEVVKGLNKYIVLKEIDND